MKKMAIVIISAFSLSLVFSACGKNPEKTGDAFLAAAEKVKDPRTREEREKKAYLKYIEAINFYTIKGKEIPVSLKEKYLKLTLAKLNREFSRYSKNAEEANLEQIGLWREDFTKFLPGIKDEELLKGYSQFLLEFANPDLMDLKDVIKVLNEVISLQVLASQAKEKMAAINAKVSSGLCDEVTAMMEQEKEGLKKKTDAAKEALVFAEYKALLALKNDPSSKRAREQVSTLRKLLVDTYSGYEKFGSNLDPEIDKYDIYLSVPKQKVSPKGISMEVALWNLTANPLEVRKDYFFLVTENNDTIKASDASKFHKITVDTKTDTAQMVIFDFPVRETKVKNLLFNNGTKISEKFFE
ncbi:MAG: hypothetical protein A2268_17020 [Candidatus Raymondbacteria bacterium RifOxyA12_full_50_37]|uniref:Uncharacterized protein n=1 Tax=Candidatus Raymondbacteria bacterium RIFOXYD12_FULL_49_13 TaxID=1817890 RepID=A0A1F7FCN8_UNCRA|nr:MAG: hypothetical protein A2268_17020 [Candidatus Raymondbacteria bacterium RifOxyA12_full_50_37]OGJ86310.1 MAG: hypothetical protein A2248_16620 [Candidatus Raymondbacteria bacterium RIFOXYA2_FULL_49_16]OGJ89993.1 MAG: hypothetical protein A2350_08075 [Candidatus Raymondbacteria bacterium RifOxyB12_full_50_8]OGJ95848.1 MAG: hypothetical protein A2453_11930 [Candidatus Raymondbacteria bacterium RIFOXYC2_FULL_50_21]OGJ99690.1 MAG: hypothetical protein A2487_03950 [Candidatus Raymondbacteria b